MTTYELYMNLNLRSAYDDIYNTEIRYDAPISEVKKVEDD